MFSEEVLNEFFNSFLGKSIMIFIALIFIALFIGKLYKSKNFSSRALTYSGIAIALATILSEFTLFSLPQGGSVTPFSMMFIVLIGYWFGPLEGILSGVTYGILQLALGAYVVHPIQILLDYPFAFGALGLSGFFRKGPYSIIYGYSVGVLGRFIFSFLSGWIFFGSYAWEGYSAITYSFLYNLSYIGIEMILTLILFMIPSFRKALYHIRKIVNINENINKKAAM
ncbi:energy-coupled thiamine transporter ThiT [Defluviitalea phaphyphila]|uniref:energy-coupled thiamine transporter ThiT n=1 Tax=Defluviitalea phaphyphila TaxID=1473580 RepID=UPI0007DBF630|nr:energy-coupled thiamine transporter ThiT [Defluviitalea phaphyphila]